MTASTAALVKPFSLNLIGPGVSVFQELCAHVRSGYVVNKDYPVDFYQNGNVSLMLILGNPDEIATAQAKESVELRIAQEQADYERRVKEEAKRLVEQQQKDELARTVAAEVAQHKRKIAEIEKQAAAALAKLQ